MFLELLRHGLEQFGYFYGKYKAQVKSANDPESLGRIQVHCPQVHGPEFPDVWALPSSPYAGKGFGFWALPDVGEWVWVSFDHGDPAYPIYEGGWWGRGDTTTDMNSTSVTLATKEGIKIVMDRKASTLNLSLPSGVSIKMSATEIDITSPKMVIRCPEVDVIGNVSITGSLSATGNIAVTGNGTVSGSWIATTSDGHHTHPIGPDPANPTTQIALPNPT